MAQLERSKFELVYISAFQQRSRNALLREETL